MLGHNIYCVTSFLRALSSQALVLIELVIEQLSSLVLVPCTRVLVLGLPEMCLHEEEGVEALRWIYREGFKLTLLDSVREMRDDQCVHPSN